MIPDHLKAIYGHPNNDIKKLEIEIIPENNVFGISDEKERCDLISVLHQHGIDKINVCFPLNNNDKKLIDSTFITITQILDSKIRVSMSNIDTIQKITMAQNRCGKNSISYFSKAEIVKSVEIYCKENGIPFLPVASTQEEFLKRAEEGYTVVKAYPFVSNNLLKIITDSKNSIDNLFYNPAGGIKPVISDKSGMPKEINPFFLECADLENVININATDPAKLLTKKKGLYDRNGILESFNNYLKIVIDA